MSNTYYAVLTFYILFPYVLIGTAYFLFNACDMKTRKKQGKLFLKSVFWIFIAIYNFIVYIFEFIKWVFECIIALFKPEDEPEKDKKVSEGYLQALAFYEEFQSSSRSDIIVSDNNTCSHCGSSKQYGGNCKQCGAPM